GMRRRQLVENPAGRIRAEVVHQHDLAGNLPSIEHRQQTRHESNDVALLVVARRDDRQFDLPPHVVFGVGASGCLWSVHGHGLVVSTTVIPSWWTGHHMLLHPVDAAGTKPAATPSRQTLHV